MVRVLLLAAAGAFGALVVWAIAQGGGGEALNFLLTEPWGLVTLADLYLGFVLISVVIFIVEEDKRIAALFILPLFLLGNIVSAVWLAWRFMRITRRAS